VQFIRELHSVTLLNHLAVTICIMKPKYIRLLVLASIFILLFGSFSTFIKVQQTAYPPVPVEPQSIFSLGSLMLSFLIAIVITGISARYLPVKNFLPEKMLAVVEAIENNRLKTRYAVAKKAKLGQSTGYRYVDRMVEDGLLARDKDGYYISKM
jgi:hypothetical protein